MEMRAYGKSGEKLSIVGFGGIVVMNETPASASRLVGHAVQARGLNYFDVAPSYGNAEERLGPALEPYRKSVFLACKTEKRTAADAEAALQQSLKYLRTDHFDLYQLHGITTLEEVEQVFAPGGAMETLVKAQERGLVRHLGFSAHSEEAALALMDRFDFESILFPFNWVSWYQGKFGPRVAAKAQAKGVTMLALKALAKRPWEEGENHRWPKCWYAPVDSYEEAVLGLRFTLSQPIASAVSPSHAELLWWACDAADTFTPMTDEELAQVEQRSQGVKPIFRTDLDSYRNAGESRMNVMLLAFELDKLSEAQLDRVRTAAPDMEIVVTQDEREIERVLDRVEIVAGHLPRRLLSKARALRWLQQWGAGADWLMRFPEAAEMPFTLTNASGVHAVPISEHILALLLAFARRLPHAFRDQARQRWTPHEEQRSAFELAGKTMALIGVGAIGERTAELASALGMHVLGVRRDPQIGAPGVAAMTGPDQLLDLLPEADFVVLTAPLTHETKHMIGSRELGAMKRTAIIINIGRGGTIDEPALIAALQEGRIAGAGLDVFETEPLPSSSPLWHMDNVIITAHYAGLTPRYDERALDIFLDNLRRYRAGEPLRNVVDKELGY